MAEANRTQDRVNQTNFSFQDKQNPMTTRHFFQRFPSDKQTQVSNPNNIPDLNLGLSLGGIYSSTPTTREKPLIRSFSSISGGVTLEKNPSGWFENPLPKSFLSLARSSSLPAEVESSKRVVDAKELRTMKRVEAKNRAAEKQIMYGWKAGDNENLVMEGPPSSPSKIPAWAAASAAKSPALNRAIDKIKEGFRQMEGQGACTSKAPRYSKNPSEPIKVKPYIASEISRGKSVMLMHDETKSDQNPTKKAKHSNGCIQDDGMEVMRKMPSVTATGDGPNGRKVEGFLYRYTKEHVSIICLCHGSFLSPEAFVKHAGFKDVTNPMKHINVQPLSPTY